jgi:hypothetical protein
LGSQLGRRTVLLDGVPGVLLAIPVSLKASDLE